MGVVEVESDRKYVAVRVLIMLYILTDFSLFIQFSICINNKYLINLIIYLNIDFVISLLIL